ncbi:MAG: hypothetical protein A2Z29_07880 [Chloroflexi bacterium RBG_16_56_11]|nr:MAG: hypothetical protein A2Z29_07880 [Chloroflexi bacterium RBG_16_56_11]
MNLRGIRYRFFHQGEYSSIIEELWDIYDRRQDINTSLESDNSVQESDDHIQEIESLTQELDRREEILGDFEDEVELLKKVTRKTLIKSFMDHYNRPI